MSGSEHYLRLAAAIFTAAAFGAGIGFPDAGNQAADRVAALTASVETPRAAQPCGIGEAALTGAFASLDDVLSVSPLGGVTAPGEVLPAPFMRINMRRAEQGTLERRRTAALAPANADIVAIERKIVRDETRRAETVSWAVHFQACENITFYYDRLDEVSDDILAKAGGLRAFTELGGPDHIAIETRIRVRRGAEVGAADGFDVGLIDAAVTPITLERPERYKLNPYPRAAVFDAAPSLIDAISPEVTQARCPLDYLAKSLAEDWAAKLGDSWGIRRAKGKNACRMAITDLPAAAQGVWYTDAAHNGATSKVSAVALSPDAVTPDRLVFALHGRLTSLTPGLIGAGRAQKKLRERAAKDFLTFRTGAGRVNAHFADVRDGQIYCYERLRANFVGPEVMGVLLLERKSRNDGPALLKVEARGDALSCNTLAEPWGFSGNETVFYR